MASDTKIPDFLREFDDAKSARRNIYTNTLEAMKKRFPVEDDNYRLELLDPHYDGPQEFSLSEQKKALLNNRNLRTNLVGTWRLTDKRTGQVLDERKESVMQVPYWTDRGTIINNGSEYTVISQSRLRPGVYARKKSNGEFEAQFNIKPGTGRAFHFGLTPETGVMTLQTGQGSVPLYQILKGMGVDDKEIIKHWGADVTAANAQKADPQAWNKLYRRMAGYKAIPNATEADKIQFIKDAVAGYEVDPEVIERTMGLRDVSTVTPALMLRASQKLLNISRGDEQPDNRDNPRFSKFYGVEDYFKERVEKNAGRLANTLLYKARRNGSLKSIQRNALNPWVDTIINGSGLAMPGEEANPLSTLEQMSRISKFGLGGIGSKDAVTMEARDVQGDYLGFVDSVQGPESEAIGVDVRASYKTFLGKDNKLYGEFIDNRTGKKEYVDIATASDRLVAFPGQDPNAKYVMAIKDGIPQRVPRDEVRYTVPSYAHMVASNTNMNPMPTGVQASRQFYGSKFWSQYLPQAKGETPLVDTLMPDGKLTWREYYGRKVGTLSSDVDGVVTKVDDDKVVIKGDDGNTYTKELTKNVPFNRLSQISYFPSVEVGQAVKAGDMVAHSNYTDKKTGAINMGQNLHVAIIPNGGSVSGDTNVLWETEDGSLTFGPICEVTSHAGMKSLASFCDDFRQELLPCNSLMAHPPDSKMYLVETLDGRRVKVTGSHSMMVFDGNTGMTTKRTDALVPGVDFIPVAKPLLPFGSTTGKLECRGRRKGTVLRLDIDEDLGWLFGIFLAEGCVCFRNGVPHDVSIAAVESEIVSRILAFCKRYNLPVSVKSSDIPSKVHPGKKNTHGSVLIFSSALAHMLHSSCGRYAWLKRLPSIVFTAQRSFAESLIDGYWCGDGCVTKECSASTTSGVLADGICFLLGAIGVKATHREYWPSGGKYRQHLIHVFRDTISSFPTLSLPRKNDALKKLKGMGVKFSLDRVPYPDGSRHAACNSAGRPSCSRSKMLRLAEKYGDKRWIELAGRNVWWDVVKSVTEIESEDTVYDLDMQPAGTFIVNTGVIVHNSFEDAYVISEGAARRMATDRLYSFDHETRNGVTIGRDKFISAYPSKFTKQQVETLDENGIVKPGTILHRGDPMILSLGPKMLSSSDKALGKLSKALRNSYTDRSEVWDHDYEGKVVDTAVTSKGAKVNVSAQPPVRVGDKLSPMAGIKGVVGQIIPDDQMPRDAVTNQPYDMLMNTMGFLSRVAPNQIIEMNLAKIAKKTGKQIRMPQLPPQEGWYRWAQAQMKAAGVPETADVFDPATGKTMKGIGDGYMYTMAFHHLAEKKASAVGADGSFTQDEQPAKGGFSGGKKTSGMDLWAMLAHNVPDVIKDSQTIRGTRNDQYWRALQLGLPTPEPEEPFIYKKFLNTLRAGGINVTEKGSITKIMPQTDKDIDQLAQGRVLTSAEMVDSDFEPVKGGLFDLGKTGGMAGNQWSMIQLPEPVPNPIMEEPVRRVLGLTVSKMEDILAGREKLDGKTGGEALRSALEKVDVDKMITESRRGITTLRGQKRDDAVKVYRYLTSMKEQGLKPQDWMVSKVPVIPPAFRPVSKMGDVALVSDMNELYKDIIENAKNYEDLRKDVDDSSLADERLDIYNSVKAAYGLGEPITPENAAKGVKGAIRQVIGSRPKFGMYQNKVLSKAVGGVARGVISPDINLDMDQCGIPEVMAWPMYKPYIMRELVRNGYPSVTAVKMIADRTDTARHVLEKVMSERPVILDRAPTWHKFNFMAFKPFLVDGDTIRVSPLIVSGFNADFDGDQMNAHVPSSEKAVKQALEKMLPSENLTSMTDMKSPRHTPSKEQIFGLYALTKGMDTSKPPTVFNSVSEAKQAYARGEIGPNDPIEIRG